MRRVAIALGLAAALVGLTASVGVGAQPGPSPEPRARAIALRVASIGPVDELLEAGTALAEAGASPRASGTAFTLAGQQQQTATATLQQPDAEALLHTYDDPSGSFTFDGGFARAHVTGATSSASSGFATGTGSGFALADELFTFEQQEQLLGAWADLMDALFGPLNDVLGMLDPALATLGLDRPTLEGISPEGLVDVGRAHAVASDVSASSSPGFSSARAASDVGSLSLFGGFIRAKGLAAEAVSESVPGADERRARATIGSLRIAGLEVVSDSDGLRLAGNGLFDTALLEPAFDALMTALAVAGIELRVADARGSGDLRQASAFEVSVATPAGSTIISVAYAEASAASVGGAAPAPEPSSGGAGVVPPAPTLVAGGAPVRPVGGGAFEAPPPPALTEGPIFRRPGPDAARAMRTAYLLVIVGGMVASMVLPLWIKRARRPGASLVEGMVR